VAAAREWLAKEVEFLTDNELMPPPMQAPALPEAPQTVVVDTKYSPLHK
jgi:hypothetical protein